MPNAESRMPSSALRPYSAAHTTLSSLLSALPPHHHSATTQDALLARMRCVVHALWHHFGMPDGAPRDGLASFSWVGFYQKQPDDSMTLLCREPKPACSPIGLHGMCGKGWKDATTYVVPDIRVLGENYIACDPKDQSEIVLPVLLTDASGHPTCWGVLDIDSYIPGAFTPHDATNLTQMLQSARLMTVPAPLKVIA
jgi:putative methionine-R-sulfoxide reductase with GAF domain